MRALKNPKIPWPMHGMELISSSNANGHDSFPSISPTISSIKLTVKRSCQLLAISKTIKRSFRAHFEYLIHYWVFVNYSYSYCITEFSSTTYFTCIYCITEFSSTTYFTCTYCITEFSSTTYFTCTYCITEFSSTIYLLIV